MEIKFFSESGLRPSAKWAAWKKMSWLIGSHQEPGLAGRVSSVFTWSSLGFLWFPLKWKFLAEIMTCGPNFAEDYVSFYTASDQANLQRHNYQIRTGKQQCQAAYSDQEFWFLTLLPREEAEQGCLCQQWTGCLGSSFLGNWTTAIGELSFFSKNILNKIRI